jgi:cytoskeletal protein RodZ
MKRIVSLAPPESDQKKESFLTKKSSWLKLATFLGLILILVWFNRLPDHMDSKPANLNDKAGQVAGIESTRAASKDTDNTQVATVTTPQTDTNINDHISGGGDEANSDSTTTVASSSLQSSTGPTTAQTKTENLIGSDSDINLILQEGKKYLDSSQLDKADTLFTRATEVEPEYRDAWYLLGYTYLKEFEKNSVLNPTSLTFAQKAVVVLTRAHAIDPVADNVNSLRSIAKKAAGLN